MSIVPFILALAGCGAENSEPPAVEKQQNGGRDQHADHGEAHGSSQLMLSTTPAVPQAGESVRLELMIHRADGTMVQDFEITHEKKLHLIIVREGLDHFAHVHPDIDAAGKGTIEFTFPVSGKYLLYADQKPVGEPHSTARAELAVEGESPPSSELVPNVPGVVTADGLKVGITLEKARQEADSRITFDFDDASGGTMTDLEPYLGAMGHLVVISAEGKEYVHAHPLETVPGQGNRVRFETHFTRPGIYAGWGQFQRAGKILTVPFVLNID